MLEQLLFFLTLVLVIVLVIFGSPYLPALGRAVVRSMQDSWIGRR